MKYRYEIMCKNDHCKFISGGDAVDTRISCDWISGGADGLDLCSYFLRATNLVTAHQWEYYSFGVMRLVLFNSEEDAENDDRANAAGQIVRKPITDEDGDEE